VLPAGEFILSAEYSQDSLDKLERAGAIGLLHAPPLTELPGFDMMAERLAEIGILSADQLLEKPIDEISNGLEVDISTVRQWRADVSNWLVIPVRPERG
jgi:hypothetical protein